MNDPMEDKRATPIHHGGDAVGHLIWCNHSIMLHNFEDNESINE